MYRVSVIVCNYNTVHVREKHILNVSHSLVPHISKCEDCSDFLSCFML